MTRGTNLTDMLPMLMMLTLASARPMSDDTATSQTATSTDTLDGPESKSHLLFYLMVEKELVPQTQDLAARALHIFKIQCSNYYNKTSDCLLETDQLPEIAALNNIPSQGALKKEGSKVFSKHLLKDVHNTLFKLQILLEEENAEEIEPLSQLISQMARTRHNLETQMNLFYHARLRQRENYTTVAKSKKRYMRLTRLGDDCRHKDENDDNDDYVDEEGEEDEEEDECLTEDDYRLRLLYSAYRHLLRAHHVLGYTVRLSWLAVEEDLWP